MQRGVMSTASNAGTEPANKYRLAAEKAAIIRTNPPVHLSCMEGAAYLGISPRKLRELITARRVKCARIGSKIIFRREHLDELTRGCA